ANPNSPGSHYVNGNLLNAAGKTKEAEAEYRKAIELQQDFADAWLNLIQLLVHDRRPQEALETVQKLQLALPEDHRSLVMRHAYEVLGSEAEADPYYQQAISENPDEVGLKQHIAQFYLRTNHLDKAKQYLDQILASQSTKPADKATIAWAGRVKAQLLATSH